MCNKKLIADNADMIVNGYAFTKSDANFRVLNLNRDNCACVVSASGEIIETSMDDIELSIVKDYFVRNKNFLAGEYDA